MLLVSHWLSWQTESCRQDGSIEHSNPSLGSPPQKEDPNKTGHKGSSESSSSRLTGTSGKAHTDSYSSSAYELIKNNVIKPPTRVHTPHHTEWKSELQFKSGPTDLSYNLGIMQELRKVTKTPGTNSLPFTSSHRF